MIISIVLLSTIVSCTETFNLEVDDDVTKPWKDYVARDEPFYGWEDTGVRWKGHFGGNLYKLNVTSLQWLNSSVYDVMGSPGDPSIWKHEVFIIEPRVNKHRNTILLYATGDCNSDPPDDPGDMELKALEAAAFEA